MGRPGTEEDIKGLGSIIARAIISGAIQTAKDIAREEARINRTNQRSRQLSEANSSEAKEAFPANVLSLRKALRVVGIIDGLLEQTRDEWLPLFCAGLGADPPSNENPGHNINDSINRLYARLNSKGFPCDTDITFWTAVCDIQLELMLHKAFPEAWERWNEDLDNALERAAGEAKRMAGERRMETLAKVMPDGHPPTDDNVFNERLIRATHELSTEIIMPALISAGLLPENNPLFGPRLGSLIPKVLISDIVEFIRELSQSGKR